MSVVQVSVKMGSNKMVIPLAKNDSITCRCFIELVLSRCNVDASKLGNTYAIFESNNGIESRLRSKQTLLEVYTPKSELIIRKYFSTEKKLAKNIGNEQHQKMVKKYFKKMNQANLNVEAPMAPVHLTTIEQDYLHKQVKVQPKVVVVNEPSNEVSKQESHSIKMASNINILQNLYFKLKKHNSQSSQQRNFSTSYERLIEADSCGNSSDEEVSSNGSRQSSTTSLQKFESLV